MKNTGLFIFAAFLFCFAAANAAERPKFVPRTPPVRPEIVVVSTEDGHEVRVVPRETPRYFPEEVLMPTVEGSQEFSFALYRELEKDYAGGNMFFSPLGVYLTLSMAAMGAREETERQMLEVLAMKELTENEKENLQRFQKYLRYDENVLGFSILNRFWMDHTLAAEEDFQEDLMNYFGANVIEMDLRGEPEASRELINDWVFENTNRKISEILEPGMVHENTMCILANIVYFKGKWVKEFRRGSSRQEKFFMSADVDVPVTMMSQEKRFSAYLDETFAVVSLPYRGGADMIIFLPNEIDGLAELEKQLTPELWREVMENLDETLVNLKMPKFKMDRRMNLKPVLQRMGMTDAFMSMKADFTGISKSEPLWVDFILQNAAVDVDEEGTEAVAATIGGMMGGGGMIELPKVLNFHADHPFLFAIRDAKSGTILFMGRYVKPE